VLLTDGQLRAAANIRAWTGTTQQVQIGDLGDSIPSIAFGSDVGVSLRRPISTSDLAFFGSKFYVGTQADASLTRTAAGRLQTEGMTVGNGGPTANRKALSGSGSTTSGSTRLSSAARQTLVGQVSNAQDCQLMIEPLKLLDPARRLRA
jgi:hypothetical protein